MWESPFKICSCCLSERVAYLVTAGFPLNKYVTMTICLTSNSWWYENQCALEVSLNKTNFPLAKCSSWYRYSYSCPQCHLPCARANWAISPLPNARASPRHHPHPPIGTHNSAGTVLYSCLVCLSVLLLLYAHWFPGGIWPLVPWHVTCLTMSRDLCITSWTTGTFRLFPTWNKTRISKYSKHRWLHYLLRFKSDTVLRSSLSSEMCVNYYYYYCYYILLVLV